MPPQEDVTKLLANLNAGRDGAEEALVPLLYDELRSLAKQYMKQERSDHTLQTTALVHEAYLRLGGRKDAAWESKAHYLRVAARVMRHVLVDHARRKRSDKRGGNWEREPFDKAAGFMEQASLDLLSMDSALDKLAEFDQRMAQVVEYRFFGGLTIEETAKVLGISAATVKNEWRMAKAWLRQNI